MSKPFVFFALVLALASQLGAQTEKLDATQLRADMASAVLNGSEQSGDAVLRLAKTKGASGLKVDSGADLALACTDVGQRLMVKGHSSEAIIFFKAAEAALMVLIRATPDTSPIRKANYLQQVAFIRGHYLGATEQSKIDIDQAISLQPGDKNLQRAKAWIGNAHGSVFKDAPAAAKKE